MKTILFSLSFFLFLPFTAADQLQLSDKAPLADRKLRNIDGKSLSLLDLKKEKGLCVVFSCNTCPWVLAWEDRYNELYKELNRAGVGFVLINSNEAKRNGDDSFEQMQQHAKEKGYAEFAYLVDKDHVLADAFGATKTPDVFLFDQDMKLVYKGAIDDNSKDRNQVKEPYLLNAVKALVSGETIDPAETKALGCSIKRLDK